MPNGIETDLSHEHSWLVLKSNTLTLSLGTKSKATLLMQYLNPVGGGPSSKTCPRWPPQALQTTSILRMPWLKSTRSSMPLAPAGW